MNPPIQILYTNLHSLSLPGVITGASINTAHHPFERAYVNEVNLRPGSGMVVTGFLRCLGEQDCAYIERGVRIDTSWLQRTRTPVLKSDRKAGDARICQD